MDEVLSKLLSSLECNWLIVFINDVRVKGYLTRDYALTPKVWMLSFPHINNYFFTVERVKEVQLIRQSKLYILTLENDPNFGRGE